jgi:hypothetical protein
MNKATNSMQSKLLKSRGTIPYNPNTPFPNLCKNCKYFMPPRFHESIKYGVCKRFGDLNLVDGSIEYDMAGTARDTKCKGDYFEFQQSPLLNSTNNSVLD